MKIVNCNILCSLLVFLLILLGISACSPKEKRRVLVVHSYDEAYSAYHDFNHLIAERFKKEGINADIRTVYLNCEAYLEKKELEKMSELLDSVSQGWQPEVILVNEDQATYSLLKCGSPLVKETPVVFAGVNFPNWKLIKQYPNVTGFHDKIKIKENIEVVRALFRKNIRLFTVLDSTFLDMCIRKEAQKQFESCKVIGFIAYPNRPTSEQYGLRVKKDYTIFHSIPMRYNNNKAEVNLMMWILNKSYRNQCYVQLKRDYTTQNLANICGSPSITVINDGFGYNEKLLGGYITSLSIQVKEEVEAASRILRGESPSNIPVVESRKEYIVDWSVIQQLDIPKEYIPNNYVVLHMPMSEQYPVLWITTVITVVMLLIILFSCLLWLYLREQGRKRHALNALEDEKETLNLAIQGGNTYVWKMIDEYFIFEKAFWLSQGVEPRDVIYTELKDFIHPDHYEEVKICWRHLKEAQKKKIQIRCDFNGKGYHWWEFRYTTKLLPDGKYKTAGLLLNIQEMKDREEELEAARLLAEKAELKQSFLANMSHEIRTPLNSIVGFANILAIDEELNSEERLEYIETINKNSDLLLKLVNDILELSRIESGYMSFSYKKCMVKELVDDVYMTHQVLIAPRLEFIKEEDKLPMEIDVDRDRLVQVLTNFLNNAAKFTEKGSIKLGYDYLPEKEQVCIYVKDTGRGIPREEQQIIFSRFYKQNEFSQGAGLGLSICKVIVEKLSGHIELKSELGKGSCFMVILPCRVVS